MIRVILERNGSTIEKWVNNVEKETKFEVSQGYRVGTIDVTKAQNEYKIPSPN